MTPPHPYRGLTAALGTQHAKARAIARPFAFGLGVAVVEAAVDTDALGTFTGETARRGPALEAAVAKARLAIRMTGAPLGLGSEGSFGPDPAFVFVPSGEEIVALVESASGRVIHASARTFKTNFSGATLARGDDPAVILATIGLPDHAAIVRPVRGRGPIAKGLVTTVAVRSALDAVFAAGNTAALVEADMRAHVNPTRMRAIRVAARRLVRRLAALCPVCAAPGFGETGVERGLPCRDCGTPTVLPRARRLACEACGHLQTIPITGTADPSHCAVCNP